MTSTTLTTAPITKSVQVPKKVRIVPIASSFFFARRSTGGSFRFPKQSVSGSDSEAIDRICVYIIDIVFVWVSLSLSPSLRGRETLQQLLESSFRRRPTKKRELLLLSRARERERESNSTYTAFYSRARQRRTRGRRKKRPLVDDDVIEKHFDTLDFLASFFFREKEEDQCFMHCFWGGQKMW